MHHKQADESAVYCDRHLTEQVIQLTVKCTRLNVIINKDNKDNKAAEIFNPPKFRAYFGSY